MLPYGVLQSLRILILDDKRAPTYVDAVITLQRTLTNLKSPNSAQRLFFICAGIPYSKTYKTDEITIIICYLPL